MPLIAQHRDPAVTEEFLNLYGEVEQVSQRLSKHIVPPRIRSPGIDETLPMPFFAYKINFVKTLDAGVMVHHFETWPVAVISGPYRLQALDLLVHRHDGVNDAHLTNITFKLKQRAAKRDVYDPEVWDTSESLIAEWNWDLAVSTHPDFRRRAGWNRIRNTPDGDTLFLEFGSKVTSAAPAGKEWKYSAILSGFYMPVDLLFFEAGERI